MSTFTKQQLKNTKILATPVLGKQPNAYELAASYHAANSNDIPAQSGNSGKFLTTNGSVLSWSAADALPAQSGHGGQYLTTNGTAASWTSLSTFAPSLINAWSDSTRPAAPLGGEFGFNTDANEFEFYDAIGMSWRGASTSIT